MARPMTRGALVEYTGPRISLSSPGVSVTIEPGVFGHVMEIDPLDPLQTYVALHPVAYSFRTTDLKPVHR